MKKLLLPARPKDCSGCNELEEEHNYHVQLETLVEQRTAALSRALHDLESANKAKSVFLSNMSHELRTPLNAILGFSRQMERDPAMTPEHKKKLATIHRSGEHLLALINDVLELTRSDESGTQQATTTFALDELLGELDETTRGKAAAKGLKFSISRSPELPGTLIGQPERLRRILGGLLGNAVKYTATGEIAVRVKAQAGTIRFEVADTGLGIPPEERKHLFQAFYQTAAGIAHGEGTGLGLYLGREYARRMGGDLKLRSEPPWASIFVLEVPLLAAETTPRGRITGVVSTEHLPRLLVVDDQEDNRWLACELLGPPGFPVQTAENGQQAIDAFLASPPDLIWMDMRMPILDGYEATRRIRALPGGQSVKIVAMTASNLETEQQEILAAGCDAIVSKPLDDTEIFATLARLLDIRYRYAEERTAISTSGKAPELLQSPTLAPTYRDVLIQAAERLDLEECRQIEARMRNSDSAAAEHLAKMLEQFRFDQILQWCNSGS